MAEDDAPTPIAGDEKPFFAIDAEDLAGAQSSDPRRHGTTSSTDDDRRFGRYGWTRHRYWAPTSQLTGDITAFSGQQMFAIRPNEKKKGFEWGQFLLGLFVPFVVFAIFGGYRWVYQGGESNYEDPWRYETIVG